VKRASWLFVAAACAALAALSCGGKLPPLPAPGPPVYPDFVFPAVPAAMADNKALATRVDRGWRFLQANDLAAAQREFAAALSRDAGFYPAETGLGCVSLAQRDYRAALTRFDRVLQRSPRYAPALAGRGDSLFGAGRGAEALEAFEKAVAADPALSGARQRVQVLRLRTLQDEIAGARRAADAGRYDEARSAYERAIAASPESGFLYRDLGTVQRRQGDATAAHASFRRAVALDPSDAKSLVQIGEILEANGDFDGAVQAYGQAAALEPGEAMAARLERAKQRAALAHLPPEFAELAGTPRLTRADLAALVGVRFADLLDSERGRSVVLMTDTRGSWAAPWILSVVQAGIMDAYPNHTFRPRLGVARLDLASAVSHLLDLAAASRPALAARWQDARPSIADMPSGHLSYPAVAQVVAAGVMPLQSDGTFGPTAAVSGQEALQVMDRVGNLLGRRGTGPGSHR
jgi:tetratricopeptide (TPR) repeat protein